MKTKLTLSNLSLTLAILIGIFIFTSCNNDIGLEDQSTEKGNLSSPNDFFETYAGDYKYLFPEDAWELMSKDAMMALKEYVGSEINLPNANVEWIPFVMRHKDAVYSVAPHYKNNIMDGFISSAKGDGIIIIDQIGVFDDFMTTDQLSYISGSAEGIEFAETLKFSLNGKIIDMLSTPKIQNGFFDAVIVHEDNMGMLKGINGFSLRKSIVEDFQGPLPAPNSNVQGSAEIVSIGYLLFTK